MSDIGEFISNVGSPIAFAVALGFALWQVFKWGGKLLLEQWKLKESRLESLEKRVEQINNGQREALEKRLDDSIDVQRQNLAALTNVAGCLNRMGTAFAEFAASRPCLLAEDVPRVTGNDKPTQSES